MAHKTLDDFLQTGRLRAAKGPIAMIFVEDLIEVDATC